MKDKYPAWTGWPAYRTAIIAEVGINHGGDESLAWEMIVSAHENGADFIKLQSYTAESLVHPSMPYFKAAKSMELSFDVQGRLFRMAKNKGIALITTPYDRRSADFVSQFDVACYKIASMDNDNYPLTRHMARYGKPVLVSTGMADMVEIEKILHILKEECSDKFVLLHCVSEYPTKPENADLFMLRRLREEFNCFIGLSDHSMSLECSKAAASFGAAVIEKHFTIDKALAEKMPEADHDISMTPRELKELRYFCEAAPPLTEAFPRDCTKSSVVDRDKIRRGIYALKSIAAGERLSLDNVIFLRPVAYIKAGEWGSIAGKITSRDIEKYAPIRREDLIV